MVQVSECAQLQQEKYNGGKPLDVSIPLEKINLIAKSEFMASRLSFMNHSL